MIFQFDRKDACWTAVSLATGKLWVIEIHDNGFFTVNYQCYRTFFDAVRVCEADDAHMATYTQPKAPEAV